jgi:hypothetical protein
MWIFRNFVILPAVYPGVILPVSETGIQGIQPCKRSGWWIHETRSRPFLFSCRGRETAAEPHGQVSGWYLPTG